MYMMKTGNAKEKDDLTLVCDFQSLSTHYTSIYTCKEESEAILPMVTEHFREILNRLRK